jgi:hypothetical protein
MTISTSNTSTGSATEDDGNAGILIITGTLTGTSPFAFDTPVADDNGGIFSISGNTWTYTIANAQIQYLRDAEEF